MPSLDDDAPAQASAGAEQRDNVGSIYEEPDGILRFLVDIINRSPGLEISVTLHVSGVIVSGLLMSGKSYFEALQAQMISRAGDDPHDLRRVMGEALGSFAEPYAEIAGRSEEEHEKDTSPTVYAHMRAATIHAPGATQSLHQDLWRGRLSHVSGWSLMNFETKPPALA